jgi:hypothetical protein
MALAALHKLMGQLPGGVVCSGEAVRSGPIWWTTRRRRDPPAVASQADTSVPGPAGDTPGRRSARPDDRSQVVAPAVTEFEAGGTASNHDSAAGHAPRVAWAASSMRRLPMSPQRRAEPRAAMPMPAGS